MILSEGRLRAAPAAFRAMTGLQIAEFDALAQDVVPSIAAAVTAEQDRRRGRRRRRYQALTQQDRQHRRGHAARVRAVAGLVNRQLDHRFGALT